MECTSNMGDKMFLLGLDSLNCHEMLPLWWQVVPLRTMISFSKWRTDFFSLSWWKVRDERWYCFSGATSHLQWRPNPRLLNSASGRRSCCKVFEISCPGEMDVRTSWNILKTTCLQLWLLLKWSHNNTKADLESVSPYGVFVLPAAEAVKLGVQMEINNL